MAAAVQPNGLWNSNKNFYRTYSQPDAPDYSWRSMYESAGIFLIRMLTGDEFKSGGEANLMGFDLQSSRRDFLRNIGYCPQFDSIIEVLTGREMLRLFARLRGIPSGDIESNIDKWLDFLSIQQGLFTLKLASKNERIYFKNFNVRLIKSHS